MTAPSIPAILREKISKLELSEGFKAASDYMGFKTLQEIIATEADELFKKEGFDYTWFGELIRYLDNIGLANLIQPLPGKNHG
jgi:hypothetical protein